VRRCLGRLPSVYVPPTPPPSSNRLREQGILTPSLLVGLRAIVMSAFVQLWLSAFVPLWLLAFALLFFAGFGNLPVQGRCYQNFKWVLTFFALFVGGAPMGGTR
jgi:hypothetical protein